MADQITQLEAGRIAVHTCLVLGGARSGKSAYAQRLAEASDRRLVFLATATAWDDEMRQRIARHQADRDTRWSLAEEELALASVLQATCRPDTAVVVDCLTLWLTNLVLGEHAVEPAVAELAALLPRLPGALILVSNEVGSGIVPENALGRRFRDAQGRLNQAVAAAADTVVFVAAGLPLILKPAAGPVVSLVPAANDPS